MPIERTALAVWLWEHGLNQSQLAAKLGLQIATVSRAATGEHVTAGMWAAFADYAGVDEARRVLGPLQVGRNKPPAEVQP